MEVIMEMAIQAALEQYAEAQTNLIATLKSYLTPQTTETWVTTIQASKRTGEPVRNIQNWAKAEKIRVNREGKFYEVCLEDVITKHESRKKA